MSRFTHFSLTKNGGDAKGDREDPFLPDFADLSSRIRFLPDEGRIWLDDQRMSLFSIDWQASLRREIFEALGPRKAREALFRMGHVSGNSEARLAQKLRQDKPEIDAFLIGPQLHSLRGEVFVEPVVIEADLETGHYFSELIWRDSIEAETHLACFGGSSQPVCWMQLGYASGYTSALMERPILFRETSCVACGGSECRIVGKPAEDWPDGQDPVKTRHIDLAPKGSIEVPKDTQADGVVGVSTGFLSAWYLLARVAPLSTTVLLQGETGVGKEIFARALHKQSARSHEPFYSVNCAAIPESLIDPDLFGVAKGAYTGANQSRAGWFETADGGTLLLDEIGTLSREAQAKLLRVLQEGTFNRVGETRQRSTDVRIICATNVDLAEEAFLGNFRLDLLHRLNVFPIRVPPLRERRDDIPPLTQYFLSRFNEKSGRRVSGFTNDAVDALLSYEFPGNVRELENMIERAAILTLDEEPIDRFHLLNDPSFANKFLSPVVVNQLGEQHLSQCDSDIRSAIHGKTLEQLERAAINQALEDSEGNVSKAAAQLGLTRSQLRYRLKDR